MYGKPAYKDTVYFEYVKANVLSILGTGKGAYDIKALAAACGLKPTHNFKRRVHQMIDLGLIVGVPALTANGGMYAVYMLPEVEPKDYPF